MLIHYVGVSARYSRTVWLLTLQFLKEILLLSLNDSGSSGLLETIEIMSSGGIPDKLWATLNCE